MKNINAYFLVLLLTSCAGISEEEKIQTDMDKKAKMDSLFNDSLYPKENQNNLKDTFSMKLRTTTDSLKRKP